MDIDQELQDLYSMPVQLLVKIKNGEPRKSKERIVPHNDYEVRDVLLRLWRIRDRTLLIDTICSKHLDAHAEAHDHLSVFSSVWGEALPLIDPSSVPRNAWPLILFSMDIKCPKIHEKCQMGKLRYLHSDICMCGDSVQCNTVHHKEGIIDDLNSVMARWNNVGQLWAELKQPVHSILSSKCLFKDCTTEANEHALLGVFILLSDICEFLTIQQGEKNNLLDNLVRYLANYSPPTLIQTTVIRNPTEVLHLAVKAGASIHESIRPRYGWRPLERAMFIKDLQLRKEVVKELVSLGADLFDFVYDSRSAFVRTKTLSTMCRDCPQSNVEATDFFQRGPLIYALLRYNCTCDSPCECIDKCKLWLSTLDELGADVTQGDQDGASAIHVAATGPMALLECIVQLSRASKIVELEDKKGASPLHYAAFANNHENVKFLLMNGARSNHKDHAGCTPLDVASFFGFQEIMSVLSTPMEAYERAQSSPIFHNSFIMPSSGTTDVKWYLKSKYDYKVKNRVYLTNQTVFDSILNSPLVGCTETEESKEIKQEVRDLVRRLAMWIKNYDQTLSLTVKLRGSSAECTKVGFPDEFDFSFIMKNMENPMNYTFKQNEDQRLAEFDLKAHLGDPLNPDFPQFHRRFLHVVFLAMNERSLWQGSRLKMITLKMGKVGPQLTLQWNGTTYRHMMISVDLVPLFPISKHPFIPLDVGWPRPVDFSGCKLCMMMDRRGEMSISYSDLEVVLMNQLPPAALDAYRFSKAIRSPYVSQPIPGSRMQLDQLLTSYFLKNVLMRVFMEETVAKTDTDSISMNVWMMLLYERVYDIGTEDRMGNRTTCVIGDEHLDTSYPFSMLLHL